MANLWLWFPNAQERRQYVIKLLGLDSTETEELSLQEEYLSDLEAGKTCSPWYCLEGKFYMNITEKYQWQSHPFQELPVWEKGFRRIYTQNSYYFRPGHWLVLKLRDNAAGRKVRKYIQEAFPPERLGTKVPLPLESEMFLRLRDVRAWLSYYATWLGLGDPKPKLLKAAYQTAQEILQAYPHLFTGDDVYLWEDMARFWENCGELEKAVHCLQTQAQLQPGITDSWLNLGAMYSQARLWGPAVNAYLRGLRFDPEDRYLKENLSQILTDKFAMVKARQYFDQLIANYPEPFNLLIAGDLLCLLGKFKDAADRYHKGANLADPDNRAGLRCLTGLGEIYMAENNYAQVKVVVDRVLESWPEDAVGLRLAVQLDLTKGDYTKLKDHAHRLVMVQPDSPLGHKALARCFLAEGNAHKARQHSARAQNRCI